MTEFVIPSELLPYHEWVSRTSSHDKRDQAFYDMEKRYLIPLFKRSDNMMRHSKEMRLSSDLNQLKKAFLKKAYEFLDWHGLTQDCRQEVKIKFTKRKSYNHCSYYSAEKKTIYINEYTLNKALGSQEECLSLMYVFIHEMAHALADYWFSADGHCHRFLHCLLGLIKGKTYVNSNKHINRQRRENKRKDKELVPSSVCLDEFLLLNNGINRLKSSQILVSGVFDSLEEAILKAFKYDKEADRYLSAIETELDLDLKSYIEGIRTRGIFKLPGKNSVFSEIRISARKVWYDPNEISYQVLIEKESEYYHRAHSDYINYLLYLKNESALKLA